MATPWLRQIFIYVINSVILTNICWYFDSFPSFFYFLVTSARLRVYVSVLFHEKNKQNHIKWHWMQNNILKMLWAILNKSWRQHPTKQHLYGHLTLITKTIKVWRTRHAGPWWRSRDELISDVLRWTTSHGRAKAGWPARTYIQLLYYIRSIALKTIRKRWTIGSSGERGSWISVLIAQQDENDDTKKSESEANYVPTTSWLQLHCHSSKTRRV